MHHQGSRDPKKSRVCGDIPSKYVGIAKQALSDVMLLARKNEAYGDSWKQRGGRGAWFTLVRPWDRLVNMVEQADDDIFAAGDLVHEDKDSDILDSIRDVRNYLFLVEEEIKERRKQARRDALPDEVENAFEELDPTRPNARGQDHPFGFDPDDD